MADEIERVVLDTNILISGLLYGGLPQQILLLALRRKILAVTSPVLLAELSEILLKKFGFQLNKVKLLVTLIEESFLLAYPKQTITILRDEPDNRVLEAALEGRCHTIITGDKQLINLAYYRDIRILTSAAFLKIRGN